MDAQQFDRYTQGLAQLAQENRHAAQRLDLTKLIKKRYGAMVRQPQPLARGWKKLILPSWAGLRNRRFRDLANACPQ